MLMIKRDISQQCMSVIRNRVFRLYISLKYNCAAQKFKNLRSTDPDHEQISIIWSYLLY